MKKRYEMKVLSVENIAKETIEMKLYQPEISKETVPGQFLHLLVPGFTLRRPISIAKVDKQEGSVTILFKIVGGGTSALAAYQPGMTIDALGPNGNGFSVDDVKEGERVLLVGGGIGVPPIYHLAKQLAEKNVELIAVLGFQSKDYVFYEAEFQKIAKTYVVTNDGSYGHQGFVTHVFSEVGAFDQYFSCGPLPMLRAITKELKDIPGKVSLEERMGCGVGACMACVLPTVDNNYKKICSDGPVFSAQEVVL
ncbi:dihydroorotate dehydrogenase electron transfer subunit [Oceanobacillus sp. J11TS1]|uniref:dihydroorotate dehydrogenase electron transfer subunit n=1 Tax=Oceanobacillus sp. J11TS1 TaxID=2807191 RepID=UPI001B06E7E5|nr:dihydroorotate dehydrogenase electron transfer subunit [Oceanobacillus sp. J11TS1]GIO21902.1 dihydroorotate dehydrogenase B (NAD(+)), electron transfer subunit [Oceanobacillus sp. J11TS1]